MTLVKCNTETRSALIGSLGFVAFWRLWAMDKDLISERECDNICSIRDIEKLNHRLEEGATDLSDKDFSIILPGLRSFVSLMLDGDKRYKEFAGDGFPETVEEVGTVVTTAMLMLDFFESIQSDNMRNEWTKVKSALAKKCLEDMTMHTHEGGGEREYRFSNP